MTTRIGVCVPRFFLEMLQEHYVIDVRPALFQRCSIQHFVSCAFIGDVNYTPRVDVAPACVGRQHHEHK